MSDKPECGDAQKMREALQAIVDICDGNMGVPNERLYIYNLAKASLAATPRNCDIGSVDELYRRFKSYCDDNVVHDKLYCQTTGCSFCVLEWSQMPYEKEETK